MSSAAVFAIHYPWRLIGERSLNGADVVRVLLDAARPPGGGRTVWVAFFCSKQDLFFSPQLFAEPELLRFAFVSHGPLLIKPENESSERRMSDHHLNHL